MLLRKCATPHAATAADAWRQRGGGPLNPQALNRYAYVLNNPVNATDPTGHANCAAMDVSSGPCTTGGGGGVGPKPPPPAVAQAAGDAITIVVGAALIANDMQQPAQPAQPTQKGVVNQSRYRERETDVGPVDVRRLKDSEVTGPMHQSKKGTRKMRATDSYYLGKDGNVYSGGENGELTYEGPHKDVQNE